MKRRALLVLIGLLGTCPTLWADPGGAVRFTGVIDWEIILDQLSSGLLEARGQDKDGNVEKVSPVWKLKLGGSPRWTNHFKGEKQWSHHMRRHGADPWPPGC